MKAHIVIAFFALCALGQGQDYGTWGDYGEPSACSRSCGGGVSHRTRKCHHGTAWVSKGCQGDDIKYESCNTQPCPNGMESFRAAQCKRFNNRQTSWIPYQDDSQACALVCQAGEGGRVAKLQEHVVDGTECDTMDSLGICLGGKCEEIGCDRRIGSTLQEDKCLECGGRGETCQTITNTFTETTMVYGENALPTIPQGTTSITITVRNSDTRAAYLVLSGHDDTKYLDSRQPPSTGNGMFTAAGADLQFKTSRVSGDTVTTVEGKGRTNSSMTVKLFYVREPVSVEMEYSVPKSRVLESNPNQPYSWIYGAWTDCSKPCGPGFQLRAVSCIDRSSGASVDDENCVQADKPHSKQDCEVKPCGTADNLYRWEPGHWGDCSAKCGVGEQVQHMYCVESAPMGDTVYVKKDLCERYSDKPPVYKRACEGDAVGCPYWAISAWVECSVTCGFGTQTRQVYCQRDPADPDSDPEVVDESLCMAEQPETARVCRHDPCPDGSNAHAGTVEVEDSNDCEESAYGCCDDGVTAATGSNGQGCPTEAPSVNECLLEPERGPCSDFSIMWHYVPQDKECQRFWYGGCKGNNNRFQTEELCKTKCMPPDGKEKTPIVGRECTSRAYGCCPDGVTAARGPNKEGCPDTTGTDTTTSCRRSRFGCCRDGVTAATGPNYRGCRTREQRRCEQSYYGCCEGKDMAASGPNQEGCSTESASVVLDEATCSKREDRGKCAEYVIKWYFDNSNPRAPRCKRFWYGGCGGNGNRFDSEAECKKGCMKFTKNAMCKLPSVTGPCRANHPRYYFNARAGNCERFTYGGCQGNENNFRSLAECEARCKPKTIPTTTPKPKPEERKTDKPKTTVKPSRKVDLCSSSRYGCCKDNVTAASGPKYKGCDEACKASKYGCCEDGITPAEGPSKEGCAETGSGDYGDCEETKYGCCPDGSTAASGPNNAGCRSTTTPTKPNPTKPNPTKPNPTKPKSKVTTPAPATTTKSASTPEKCSLKAERGPCAQYKVLWYYEKDKAACKQFWYGGCKGNDNRFKTKDECEAECTAVETTDDPDFVSICEMSKEEGPCRARLLRWFHDPLDKQCRTFYYTGCKGNENNFKSLAECQQTCMGTTSRTTPATTTSTTTTPAPYTFVPPPTKSTLDMVGKERVPEGKDIRLTCKGKGPSTPTAIQWFINGKRIGREHDRLSIKSVPAASEHLMTSVLTITKSRKNDSATYYCRSLPYSDVERKTVVVSKGEPTETTTAAPPLKTTTMTPKVTDPEVVKVCKMPKESGRCYAYIQRWYYDWNQKRCLEFVYGGCGGNSNNFQSKKDCENYCGKDESPEVVTRRPGVVTRRPEVTTKAPVVQTTPAPTPSSSDPEVVCKMPQQTGRCRGYFQRWFYDASQGRCHQFVYGGCGGNSNNFESQKDCEAYCRKDGPSPSDPTGTSQPDPGTTEPSSVCNLPVQPGNCKAYLPRFYHNAMRGTCQSFTYGGCGGNSNNFQSMEACQNYCRGQSGTNKAPQDKAKGKEVCKMSPDGGHCQGYNINWYYDSTVQRCQRFVFTGCGGNGNRFSSEAECMSHCEYSVNTVDDNTPTYAADVCSLPHERGTCSDYKIFWYYDYEKSYCTRFYYGGCAGNGNRFSSQEECEQRCVRRPTEVETTTTRSGPDGQACSYTRYGCCPDGYTAAIDSFRTNCREVETTTTRSVPDGQACSYTRYGCCPDGYTAAIDSFRTNCREVETTTTRSVPDGQACSYTRYGCCPDGYTAAIDSFRTNCRDEGVYVRPSQDSNTVYASRGRTAVLDCYSPGSAVTWYRDGYYLISDSRFTVHNNGTLVIRNIADDITGIYSCRINDGNNIPRTQRYELHLKIPLSILQSPPTVKVAPGEHAFLHCQAFGNPKPTVSWTMHGTPIYSGGRLVVFNNGTLMVTSVSQQDAGNYQCTAVNGMDAPAVRDVQLLVAQDISVRIMAHSGTAMEGETVRLRCEVSGYPRPSVTWHKDGREVTADTKMYTEGNTLVVPRLVIEDAGMYVCEANNGVAMAKDKTYLQVKLANHHDKCTNTMTTMKCKLIVTANLCGHRMFSRRCCLSCNQAGLLRK